VSRVSDSRETGEAKTRAQTEWRVGPWRIWFDPPPIPIRTCDWHYQDDNEETRCGDCPTMQACLDEIWGRVEEGKAICDALMEEAITKMAELRQEGDSNHPAITLAYGLLWHMRIDRRDDNLCLASDARAALLTVLSKAEQAIGITQAKATDGRFTGAA
jgi:hypothetical protein